MIATYQNSKAQSEIDIMLWNPEVPAATNDIAIWDDIGLVEFARGDAENRNLMLGQLLEMIFSSLDAYAQIHEFAEDVRMQSFAEVVLRQRSDQYQALLLRRSQQWGDDSAQPSEVLAAINTAWRLAIWNLEQDRRARFIEYAELAESLLEDSFLAAASAFDCEDWQPSMREVAVMICGALNVWEEFENELEHSAEFSDNDIDHVLLSGQTL